MVAEEDWGDVCDGLVRHGVCTYIREEDVFHTSRGPLLNGLFGVTKDEWTSTGVEVFRLNEPGATQRPLPPNLRGRGHAPSAVFHESLFCATY